MISIETRGFRELYVKLSELPAKLAVKTLAQAARKAFRPVLDDARAMVPKDTGALRDSLRLAVRRGGRNEPLRVGIRIGAAKGGQAGNDVPPARRWHFVELGTADLAPHPFLRPALDRNRSAVLEGLRTEIAEGLAKLVREGR